MKLRAMAKINLGLDVVRRREDGYHEVRMIMQTIRMYDTLELTATEEPGIRVKTNLKYLPVNEDGNSVFEIPVASLDEPMTVIGDTVAMSKPHEIEYTITFHPDTVTEAE